MNHRTAVLSTATAFVLSTAVVHADLGDQLTEFLASDGAALDVFGASVSISGDTAIVGAYRNDDSGHDSGSAYIFQRDVGGPDNWGQVIKLTAADAAADDLFGVSSSLSGDTAIVGAVLDDDAGAESGSAYLFQRNAGGPDNWGQVAKLTANDAAAGDFFGFFVAISGTTALVGAYKDGDSAEFGAAYVFDTTTGQQITKLTASDAAAGDHFGISVSLSGNTAIVGSNAGSAYLFQRDAGGPNNWGEVAKLSAGGGFGRSVSVSGGSAIVGAFADDDSGHNAGAAYVFQRDLGGADNWGQLFKLTASDGAEDDWFGKSVALSGDTAIVVAPLDDDNGVSSGSAYLFDTLTGQQTAKVLPDDGAEGDVLGLAVAIDGPPGEKVAIVGAHLHDDLGLGSGSAYLFDADAAGSRVFCDTNPDNVADINVDTVDCAAGSIHVSMVGAPSNRFGYLLIGSGDATLIDPPGAQGDLCLGGGPIGRYSRDAGLTDSSGFLSVDILNAKTGGGGGNIPTIGGNLCSPAGQTWNFQFWHRDGANPSKFSKALSVTFH